MGVVTLTQSLVSKRILIQGEVFGTRTNMELVVLFTKCGRKETLQIYLEAVFPPQKCYAKQKDNRVNNLFVSKMLKTLYN